MTATIILMIFRAAALLVADSAAEEEASTEAEAAEAGKKGYPNFLGVYILGDTLGVSI